jgi:hypothetical protein
VSPDEWGKERLDDLAYQVRTVAALTTLVATHDAKIDGLGDDVEALRTAHREFVADSREALRIWSEACDKKIQRIEARLDRDRASHEWTLSAKLTLFAALFGPLLGALVIVLVR